MSSPTDRFQTNTEEVAAKVMDGEAIMINLSDGTAVAVAFQVKSATGK